MSIRRCFLWMGLLQRRLLRRPVFLAILLLAVILSAALGRSSDTGEAGVLTVALSWDRSDACAEEVANELLSAESTMRFVSCGSMEEARRMVEEGSADAAWIFAPGLRDALQKSLHAASAAVTVVEREGNPLLTLSREKLYAALYPRLSRLLFADFLSEEAGHSLDASELEPYYSYVQTSEEVLRFTTVSGTEQRFGTDYLRAPLRGLLCILILLSGLAGAGIHADDRESGVLVWCAPEEGFALRVIYSLTPMLDAALVCYLALLLSGLVQTPLWELALMLLLVFAGSGLTALVGCLFRKSHVIAPVSLLLTVAMLALCPVFLSLPGSAGLGRLFPAWYYLHGVRERAQALWLLPYGAVCWALLLALSRLNRRN